MVLISPGVVLWAFLQQIILGSQFGNDPTPDWILIILTLVICIGLPAFIYSTGLDTQVTDSGVMIRFHPFHRRPILFEFADIQKAEACSYRAFRDYGGWGIRYGKNGKAYNVSGHLGVSLRFVNGTHLMIGSQNHETLAVIINKHIT